MIVMRRVEIRVRGRVQGVGFRYFAQHKARAHTITGWVRNTDDGDVELEAQGEPGAVEKFCSEINQGPPLSYISDVTVHDIPVQSQESGSK